MHLRDNFTSRARSVVLAAAQEALRFGHKQVDTEHLLLALIRDSSGVAGATLNNVGVHTARIALEIDKVIGLPFSATGNLQPIRSAAAERVIECAIVEAEMLEHQYVGTEHLLLGLMREETGVAGRVLESLGLTAEAVREEVRRLVSPSIVTTSPPPPTIASRDSLLDAEREFFIGLYRSAVTLYKPRIESKVGISLGDIAVWDYSCLHQHVLNRLLEPTGSWLVRMIRRSIVKRRIRRYSHAWETTYADWARKCGAAYYRGAIYVSFSSGTCHEDAIAAAVVHELSHAVWERIAGVPIDEMTPRIKGREIDEYDLFVEGFATYGERIWFQEVYPASIREAVKNQLFTPDSVHHRGFCRVEKLVNQHGPHIFLEIPKRWRSF